MSSKYDLVSGRVIPVALRNSAPGSERSTVDLPAYRTMTVAQIQKLRLHFVLHHGACTLTSYHDRAPVNGEWEYSLFLSPVPSPHSWLIPERQAMSAA